MKIAKWAAVWLGLLGMLFACNTLFAQGTNSGVIRGIVTDSSGAAIKGATVLLKDIDKGTEKSLVTDGVGLYDSGPLIPDHYLVTVKSSGFKSFVRGPLTISVGLFTVNAVLEVGAAQSEIVVNDEVPQLDTESGAQSGSIDATSLTDLPQTGADWQNAAILLPGVAINSGVAAQTTSVNGNQPYNSTLVNGANATLPMSQNTDVAVLETIAEVKMDTSAFSAQNGTGGAVFNQITKSGSNSWHGVAYEHLQNDFFNAADYGFGKGSKAALRYHNFGGSVSGPILHNKLFFYFNYDRINHYGGSSNGFTTMPTEAMMGGDFTGMPTLYDPTTQTIDASGNVVRKSFTEEYGSNAIPSTMISSVAKAIQKYFPSSSELLSGSAYVGSNGLPKNNYFYNIPNNDTYDKYFGRLDYDITPSNRLTISEISQNFRNHARAIMCDIQCQEASVEPNFAQITDVWTISNSLVNEARIGYAHELDFYVPDSLNKDFPTTFGWSFAKANLPPSISISDMNGMGPASNSVYKEFAFDYADILTLIKGRHVLHFGGELLANRADSTQWGNIASGNFNFTGAYTEDWKTNSSGVYAADTTTGASYADFLLGYSKSWDAYNNPEYGGRLKIPQAFVQDDIKLKTNLTINIGLRYQGMTGWSDVKNNMRAFDPTVENSDGSLGGMWYAATHANGRHTQQKPVYDLFMPRVGFSYQLRPDTVLRGGVGLYGYTWSVDTYGSGLGSALGSSGSLSDSSNGVLPIVQLDEDGTVVHQSKSVSAAYITPTTKVDAYNGQGVSYNQYHMPVGKSLQWNFDVQHQFTSSSTAEVAYVGNHGYDLPFDTNLNQVPESKLAADDASSRPYTNFLGIGGRTAQGYANYNSLQFSFDKRMSHDLQFNANYVWSHFLDNASSAGWNSYNGGSHWQRAYDPEANYGSSNYDHRHVIKGYGSYVLPLGAGHRIASRNAAVNQAIAGWQTTLTVVAETGRPFTVYMNTSNSYAQYEGNQYPNMVGKPRLSHRTISEWYNIDAFEQPTAGTFGNNRRNNVYGPGMSEVNFSLGKSFTLTHRAKLQVRADATNLLNHPSWGLPGQAIGGTTAGQISSVSVGGRTMQLFGRLSF